MHECAPVRVHVCACVFLANTRACVSSGGRQGGGETLPPPRASRRASSHPRGRGESWWGQQWAAKFSLLRCGVGKPSPLGTSPALSVSFPRFAAGGGDPGDPGRPPVSPRGSPASAAIPGPGRPITPSHSAALRRAGTRGSSGHFALRSPTCQGSPSLCQGGSPVSHSCCCHAAGWRCFEGTFPCPHPLPLPAALESPSHPPPRVCPEGPGGRPGLSTHLAACGLPGSRDSAEGVARPGSGTGAPVKQPDGVAVRRTIGR